MRNPVDLAHLFADIMNSHNPGRFAELVSENYVNHNPGVEPGRAGLITFMGHWFDTLSDTRVVVEDAFAVGDRVVGRYTYHARHTGPFVGVPASGADALIDALERTWQHDPSRFYEDAFQLLADERVRIGAAPIGDVDWVEIDDHIDLTRALELACRS